MTYAAIETSLDDGRPVELLLVSFLTNKWCYTTSDENIVHDGNTYVPMPIDHGEITNTGDVSKASVDIKVPYDCPVGELFRVQPPSGIVTVTLYSRHVGSTEVKVIWKGRIVNAEWESPWLTMTVENVFSSLRRMGLRRKYSIQCTHTLYSIGDGLCNVDRDAFKSTHVTTSVSGVVVGCTSAAGLPYGHMAGGFITWISTTTGFLEQRMIVDSDSAGNFTLHVPPVGLSVGVPVTVYPGCDHSQAACDLKFANSPNYGGTPYIPSKNPFGGTTLY